jgi:hypothetical protein
MAAVGGSAAGVLMDGVLMVEVRDWLVAPPAAWISQHRPSLGPRLAIRGAA